MKPDSSRKRLALAAAACLLLGGGWWALSRRKPSPPAAPAPAAAPETAADENARRRALRDERASRLLGALKSGDDAAADRLAAEMIADTAGDEINPRHALKAWRARQLEKWRAARAANDAASSSAALAAMSAWEPLDSDLPRDLVASVEPDELLALADASLKSGAFAPAALLLRAALMARGDRRQAQAQAMLDDAIMGLAAGPTGAGSGADGLPASVGLYLRVAGERRTEALNLAGAILEKRADELLAGEPRLSGPLYDEAERRLSEAASIARNPLPDDVAARLRRKAADARLAAVLKKLDAAPESAFADLRPLMRDGKDEARSQRALETVVDSWRKARDEKAFDRLVDLSAFLIAEEGSPPDEDPFRAEFKAGLIALAEDAKKEALAKRVFALTLLADAYPGEPEGRAARLEAAARGAELARALKTRGEPPPPVGPSGLPGRSVVLVENPGPHHVLMLFEGPETFCARVNPYSRGSIVLKDGKYLFAVSAIKDEVAPYSADAAFASVIARQTIVAAATGPAGPARGPFGTVSAGSWSLLRAPDGEKFAADQLNGTVRP